MKPTIKRGDIYYAHLDPVVGSEQGGLRPSIIVQNQMGNLHSPTVVIIPLTRKMKKNNLPTHVLISRSRGLGADSIALAEQIRTVDRSRLGSYVGRISAAEQANIDKALMISIGLEKNKEEILLLVLCPRCRSDFQSSGYMLVKRGWQAADETCDFCHAGRGWEYGVFRNNRRT